MKYLHRIITVAGIALILCANTAFAKTWRIAILNQEGPESFREISQGLKEGIDASGIPHKYVMEKVFTAGEEGGKEAAEATKDMLSRGANIFITIGSAPTQGARKVLMRTSIPQIYVAVADPVGQNLVPSEEGPSGSNIAGVSYYIDPSRELSLMHRIAPDAKVCAYVYDSTISSDVTRKKIFDDAAKMNNLTMRYYDISTEQGIKDFENDEEVDVSTGWLGYMLLRQKGIKISPPKNALSIGAAVKEVMEFPRLVGLMLDNYAIGQQASIMAANIMGNAINIGDIPCERPTKIMTMVNMKTAIEKGVSIPYEILIQSEKIIK